MDSWTHSLHSYLYFRAFQYGLYLWQFPNEAEQGMPVWQNRAKKATEETMSLTFKDLYSSCYV